MTQVLQEMRPEPAPADSRGTRRGLGVVGACALAGDYADDLIVGTVRDVHGAVAKRVFALAGRPTGGSAHVSQAVHDGICRAVYTGIGAGVRAVSSGLRAAERRGYGPRLEDSPRGRFVLSAVNGLIGDRLEEEQPDFAITMAVRQHGRDVPVYPASLAAAFPQATGDLVVFLHGLSENEEHWNRRREKTGGSYGDRLAAETSWTPVYLRANTGLPIADNGVVLASLLDRLIAASPTGVRRIALVGHSMGGLIMRAACAVVSESEPRWNALVTDVVTLGSPHLGAPMAKTVHAGAAALGRFPESAPLGRILEYRSVGILNLRGGLAPDVQALPHARYHLVAATLAGSHRHPVSEVLGDMLVRYPSAVGRPRRGREMFPGADVLHLPGAGHFDLLNHPHVYAAIRDWLR